MDKANQHRGAGTAVPSNAGSSAQLGGLNNLSTIAADLQPDNTSILPFRSEYNPRNCQCEYCRTGARPFIGFTGPKKMNTAWNPVPEKALQSPKYTTFSGVTLDRTQSGQLSEFRALDGGGDAIPSNEQWETMANQIGGVEVIFLPTSAVAY